MSPGQDDIRRLTVSVCAVMKVIWMEVCFCISLDCTRLLLICQYARIILLFNIFEITTNTPGSPLLNHPRDNSIQVDHSSGPLTTATPLTGSVLTFTTPVSNTNADLTGLPLLVNCDTLALVARSSPQREKSQIHVMLQDGRKVIRELTAFLRILGDQDIPIAPAMA